MKKLISTTIQDFLIYGLGCKNKGGGLIACLDLNKGTITKQRLYT